MLEVVVVELVAKDRLSCDTPCGHVEKAVGKQVSGNAWHATRLAAVSVDG